MTRFRVRGFTFVELMIAASIFAIIAVAIYSTFGTGISAWRKAQEAQDLYQDIRLALDKMASDLENAVLYYSKEAKEAEFVNFEGEENEISFYSLVDVYHPIPAHPELRKITYKLKDSTLQRLEQTFAESMQEDQEQESEEIAAKVSSLNLFYCYDADAQPPYEWEKSWDSDENKNPQGIKIELEFDTEEKLVFTKYIFIPTGEKGKVEE